MGVHAGVVGYLPLVEELVVWRISLASVARRQREEPILMSKERAETMRYRDRTQYLDIRCVDTLPFWLCSAAIVTTLRFLNVVDLGYDLALQIQVAQNLLAGKGLTTYRHVGLDLGEAAKLCTLTYFPCGYSVCVVILMVMGASAVTAVKFLGATGTIIGWWGWGKLADSYFRDGLKQRPKWKWAAIAIAFLTPLRFTPLWQGTDLLLWAAVPWAVIWLVKASGQKAPQGRLLDGLAGVACGLCILMRYAGIFLAAYAVCLILWQTYSQFRALSQRLGFFMLGFLPSVAVQAYINHFLSSKPLNPGGLELTPGIGRTLQRAWYGVESLGSASYAWVYWLPGRVVEWLMDGSMPWRWILTLAFCLFLVFLTRRMYGLDFASAARDVRTGAFGLFVALPLALWGCTMLGTFAYGAVWRYYQPILPLSIFVIYSSATVGSTMKRKKVARTVHILATICVVGYISLNLFLVGHFFMPGTRGSEQRTRLFGTGMSDPRHWPNMRATYELSPSRAFVLDLLKQHPEALLLSSRCALFYPDPLIDRSRLSEINCNLLGESKYLSGPAHIVLVTFDQGEPQDLWYYSGNNRHNGHSRASCFEQLTDIRLLRSFPGEGLKVLEARVPAAKRVILRQ